MKKLCLFFSMIFLAGLVFGLEKKDQFSISGEIQDSTKQKGIAYVTVTVSTDSAKLIKKLCTTVAGKFNVTVPSLSTYQLEFSAVGFQAQKLKVSMVENKTDIGVIKLSEGVALKEVAIVAQRPLVKIDVDKISYSVDSDPESKTSNTLEMLRKVPLLTVDGDDNVTLNGQSNFKVLVNGKSSSMMSRNFKDVIKSLPANSVKDIEVITNPPSKYDSEGIGGIINIITVKKTLNGYNGSVNAGLDAFGAANAGVYISSKVNKFGFSGRYSINQNRNPENISSSTRENYLATMEDRNYINSNSRSTSKGFSQNFNGEASYDIDSLNLISMSFWGYLGNNSNAGYSYTDMLSKSNIRTSYFSQNTSNTYSYGSVSGNIDYQKTYKKPDKTFTVSYKLDYSPHKSERFLNMDSVFNYTKYEQKDISDEYTGEHTLQVDYSDPLTKKHQIECGVKAIYRMNRSNSDNYRTNPLTGELEFSDARSNEMDYNQFISGMYGGYVYKLKKFSLKTGLRAELTWNNAISRSVSDTTFRSELKNIVPYITLTYKLKPSETFKLSYTQRLNRPSIWYLNPYRNQYSDLYVFYGNPELKSEIAHSFEAGYSYFSNKFNLSLTASESFTNNSIEQIMFIDANNIQNTTFDNIGKDSKTGLNAYISYRPSSKFNIGFNGNINYSYLEANTLNKIMKNEGFGYRASVNARLTLWKDAAVNGNYSYNSPYISLQGKGSGYSYYNLGFSQYFLKRKLMLTMSVLSPFNRYYLHHNVYSSDDFYSVNDYRREVRNLRLNLTYNFGKMGETVKKAKRGIQNDDLKGGGGGN